MIVYRVAGMDGKGPIYFGREISARKNAQDQALHRDREELTEIAVLEIKTNAANMAAALNGEPPQIESETSAGLFRGKKARQAPLKKGKQA
jgi:hypothetical protein